MKKIWCAALLGLLLLPGCVSETKRPKLLLGQRTSQVDRTPIRDAKLELRLGKPRILTAGKPGKITFILRNAGEKNVRIAEWFMHEPDNVLVECQNWLPGMKEPEPEEWFTLAFNFRKPITHTTLELPPGAEVHVTKELPFVSKLRISPGAERRYFIRGRLTLKSVSAAAPVGAVAVRAK